jgi:diaminohydroxyphosphoribosylaminopyrimidine deaminase/5-amino-6-(5-phosphoribosylamino)uracil reductase
MGSAARGLFELPGIAAMADRLPLELIDVRAVGPDLRIRARLGGLAS